jgi:hypothetical protein
MEITVTVDGSGAAYVALAAGEVRESVSLDGLEEAGAIPALERLELDFDFYGRLIGLRVSSSADSVLPPALLDSAR